VAGAPFISRQERFASIGSTNDVVRAWLADGTPEVCLAVADEQTAGRGRSGRTWQAPAGAALLLSAGFRPAWLPPDRVWRLPAIVSLAMADAAEEAAGLPDGAIRLKWPNDLVVESGGAAAVSLHDLDAPAAAQAMAAPSSVLKLGGVLGESEGLGTPDPRVVVGIGVNANWRPDDFPPELSDTMTSLFEASRGRPTDLPTLLDGFLGRLEVRLAALRAGRFDLADWNARQVTTGREVDIEWPDGGRSAHRALGVDAASGGLVVAEDGERERTLVVGEVRHVRIPVAQTAVGVTP
jgi:BirA family transcriptional regulator, biotin operon repressor / biotin---[acetyl-CoA-carboxylase] ligase